MNGDDLGKLYNFPQREARRGDWIETFLGWRFWPLDPWASSISIIDIAHALSNQCRFAGHVREFYSVAQHSVHVSELVPKHLALEGLLHDASEAYLVDVPKPLKALPEMAAYREAEQRVMIAVERRFRLTSCEHPDVKRADAALLITEARSLMARMVPDWTAEIALPAADIFIEPWTPRFAKETFLARFEELWGKR